ncbi:helix-turn-helix domain-containing protein [Dethiobacter alkaliphilus]|uniref:helix-turn-helix domain-containing protein n=1 Tax=Dethiobacter alkaliphilus TaxID=427926 RepID=UPI002227C0B1|nr:helix-turn-helix transcriptional regulator [Dethiobacter alkaliphilus]MCW3490226.1 helix-turn-helix domain-containing protein [Dethiobacter alkaliphilus]
MFGKRLRKVREEKGYTQSQLAGLINLSQQTIGHYELGRAKPDLETLQRIADIFNCSVDYLLGRTDIKNNHPTETKYQEFENCLRNSSIKLDGVILDDEDKQDLLEFARMLFKRKK